MSFWSTTLVFVLAGVTGCLSVRLCCNRGTSTSLFHVTLIIAATIASMWAIVYLAQMNPLIVPVLSGE